MWKVSLQTLQTQTQVIPCLAGKAHAVVWGDGAVSSCEMLPTIDIIKNNKLSDIISSDLMQQQIRDIENKKCHCTHNWAMLDSVLLNPAQLPHLLYQKPVT